MGIRSLGWLDLLTLHRYRKQILCLDSAQALTRGIQYGPLGFFSLLNPRQGTYTAIGRAGRGTPVIGQVRFRHHTSAARMTFLMPEDGLDSIVMPGLLEHLAYRAGMWGAPHIVAEVDENSCVYEALRRAGFSIYGWQRVWKFSPERVSALQSDPDGSIAWRSVRGGKALIGMHSLYNLLVPSLVQPMETPPDGHSHGLVSMNKGDMLAYTEIIYGRLGIWALPYVHPAAKDARQLMEGLVKSIRHVAHRPVYVCVRSYQGWLESGLLDLDAEDSPRQALMVKHMAITQKVTQPLFVPAMEKGAAKHSPAINIRE